MKEQIISNTGVRLELDSSDVDTPAIVVYKDGIATWEFAVEEGQVQKSNGDYICLSKTQVDFLMSCEKDVDEYFEMARKGNPEYA